MARSVLTRRHRGPVTSPGYHKGMKPLNYGRKFPAEAIQQRRWTSHESPSAARSQAHPSDPFGHRDHVDAPRASGADTRDPAPGEQLLAA